MLLIILLLTGLIWVVTVNQLLKSIFSLPGRTLLRIILSIYLVLTLFSFLYFLSLTVSLSIITFLVMILTISIILIIITRKKLRPAGFGQGNGKISPVQILFILVCILALTGMFIDVGQRKYGDWDAWALWNLHARFLASGAFYGHLFTSRLAWASPDYPLMLPSWIALAWRCSGNFSVIIPSVVAYGVLVSIVLSVFASLYIRNQAIAGFLFLALFPLDREFIARASTQYADTLMALFILLSMILFMHRKTEDNKIFYLMGFFTASSAWIKNEGILFFLVFTFYFMISSWKNKPLIFRYFIGALIPVLILIVFKTVYAPVNGLVKAQSAATFHQALDVHRYIMIGRFYLSLLFSEFPIIIPLIFTVFILNRKYFLSAECMILATMQIGFLCIFLFTARDLAWGLNTACDRLTHQLYPALLYTIICYAGISTKFINLQEIQ